MVITPDYPYLLMTENILEVLGLQIFDHFDSLVKFKKVQFKG